MKPAPLYFLYLLALALLLSSCQGVGAGEAVELALASTLRPPATSALLLQGTATSTKAIRAVPATPTPIPTAPASPTPLPPTATSTPRPSPTPPLCHERQPDDEQLLVLVSRDYGLSRDYKPGDLVLLGDYFSSTVTLGYPTQVREVIIEPLKRLIEVMQAEQLSPLVVSGFRDFAAQSLAEAKWVEQYPDWATNLSAPAGHSEHQLGTTIDFTSPELPEMVDEEFIQFHPYFIRTSEGQWLAAHAHAYGFTMSYPAHRIEETAFWYEPWHYRYVGVELATYLKEQDLTISEYLLAKNPLPCIPLADE